MAILAQGCPRTNREVKKFDDEVFAGGVHRTSSVQRCSCASRGIQTIAPAAPVAPTPVVETIAPAASNVAPVPFVKYNEPGLSQVAPVVEHIASAHAVSCSAPDLVVFSLSPDDSDMSSPGDVYTRSWGSLPVPIKTFKTPVESAKLASQTPTVECYQLVAKMVW